MLRKNFMKRLSKSASDLSGCKKKSHSTSPEEEQKDLAPFATPTHNSEDEEDQDRVRPSSAASTRSVPEEGYAAKKAKKHKLKHFWQQKEAVTAPSEVGIRNVGGQIHSVYRGHQVSLCSLVPQLIKPLKGLWLIAVSAYLVVKGLKNPKINKWEIWHCSQPFFRRSAFDVEEPEESLKRPSQSSFMLSDSFVAIFTHFLFENPWKSLMLSSLTYTNDCMRIIRQF